MKKKAEESANVVVNDSESDDDLCEVLTLSGEQSTGVWMLDSTSSFHVTPNKEWFTSYKSGDFGSVYQGDNAALSVVGIGDIKIKTQDGGEHLLKGVRHVPRLRRNLISLGDLHDNGYVYEVDRDKKTMKVKKDKVTVMKGERTKNNLYKLQVCIVAASMHSCRWSYQGTERVKFFSEDLQV